MVYRLLILLVFLLSLEAFAQVRDLFAEFEAETVFASSASLPADSSKTAPASSASLPADSSKTAPASSASLPADSSKTAPTSSASLPADSSKTAPASSASLPADSSKTAPASSASLPADSSKTAPASSASLPADSSKTAPASSASLPADSSKTAPASSASLPADSSKTIPASSASLPADSSKAAPTSSASLPVDSSKTAPASSASLPVDSSKTAPASSASLPADSSKAAPASSASLPADSSKPAPASSNESSFSRRELLGPIKVSKIRGINEIKGSYKNPRKALFFSLVLPGAGQIYVGTSNSNYIRGAFYLAAETLLWTSWYYFSVNKYNKQVTRYKSFANEHFSIGQYEQSMHNIYRLLDDASDESLFQQRYWIRRESSSKYTHATASTNNCYQSKVFENDSRHTDAFRDEPLSKTLKSKSFYDENQFYQLLSNPSYILGWDDVRERASYQELNLSNIDSETIPLAKSIHLEDYKSMRKKANSYASMQAWFFGALIVNHVEIGRASCRER